MILSPQKLRSFQERVDSSGGPDACWPWKGARHYFGYGTFWASGPKSDMYRPTAHRVSLALKLGRWPDGLTCHACDNPNCVNPAHLFEGTHADNSADMVKKGRSNAGRVIEKLRKPRLSRHDVIDIRTLRAFGAQAATLARTFGLSTTTIHGIVQGRIWRDV